ncbi:hypothetical protein GJU40_18600 [Bacillus lacus]|uniref:YwmB family TATA-box binding protein n=1 Tax=Metabacillus lacus TaxID=1983721 RepID=A0A7X2LZ07_9BACI|nr:YwmB family TATA-box binding protein [Metabacillus lacus]MRX74135.1 hypothetical protein [Metabacillus lacus]
MKEKLNVIIAVILILSLTIVLNSIGAAKLETPLERMASAADKHSISIREWSLYAKKNIALKGEKPDEFVKRFTAEHRQYQWDFQEDNNVLKATGTLRIDSLNVSTQLVVTATTLKNNQSQSYLLYEMKGNGLHTDWEKTTDVFTKKSFDIFHEKVTIFSCIIGNIDDMMKGVLQETLSTLLMEFNAVPVEQLKEQNFVSVSGYTKEWAQLIPAKKGSMNIQIAVRSGEVGKQPTVVIGTPIITTEY